MRTFFDNSKIDKAIAIDTAEQLLTELIEPDSDINFIKYNSHLGVWEIKFNHSEDLQFDEFHELYEWLKEEGID
jgi:hypothetical protein